MLHEGLGFEPQVGHNITMLVFLPYLFVDKKLPALGMPFLPRGWTEKGTDPDPDPQPRWTAWQILEQII